MIAGMRILVPLLIPASLAFAQGEPAVRVDNASVRVVDAVNAPHVRSAMHEHKLNRVTVYLSPCDMRLTPSGGAAKDYHGKYGDVVWSPAAGMHTAENLSDAPCRIIEVELKPGEGRKPVAAGAFDPVAVDPRHYKVVLDNAQVRVLRARFGPHETTAMHQHARDRVTIFLTDADLRPTTSDGVTREVHGKAGDVAFAAGGAVKHTENNAAAQPFEVIAIELKSR